VESLSQKQRRKSKKTKERREIMQSAAERIAGNAISLAPWHINQLRILGKKALSKLLFELLP
jgi:hypothetical protein